MEGQLKYLQHILRGESNRLVERVIKEMRAKKKKNRCITSLLEVRKLVGIRGMNIENEEISEKSLKKWDTEKWKNDMQEKSSLSLYGKWRKDIGGQEGHHLCLRAEQRM